MIEKTKGIHALNGKAGGRNPSHIWIIPLYSRTGMLNSRHHQKRVRNICS